VPVIAVVVERPAQTQLAAHAPAVDEEVEHARVAQEDDARDGDAFNACIENACNGSGAMEEIKAIVKAEEAWAKGGGRGRRDCAPGEECVSARTLGSRSTRVHSVAVKVLIW
jgi:hypothetical protein